MIFGSITPVVPLQAEINPPQGNLDKPADTFQSPQAKKLPSNVLAFSRKYNITEDEFGRLFMLDHEPILPIYKLPSTTAHAQLYKVTMILLENGLLNNSLTAPYPELRDSVREDGLMDGNFNKTLKRHYDLFLSAITESSIDTNATVELSGGGMQKLAEIVKELGQSVG